MKDKLSILGKKIKEIYGEVYGRFPFSMTLVNITTLLGVIKTIISEIPGTDYRVSHTVIWLLYFFIFWTAGSVCIEAFIQTFFEKNPIIKKLMGHILVVAFSGYISTEISRTFFGIIKIREDSPFILSDNRQTSVLLFYFVLILLTIFYCRYKESGFSIENYLVRIFIKIIQTGIAWMVLAVGFLILSFIFESLIDSVVGLFSVPQILIIGLYVVPNMLLGITSPDEEIGRFFEILIKYVMLIITIVGAGIIYLYMIKTIFTKIPSNEIFGITAGLFFVAIPVGFSCTAFEKDTTLQKIAYILPYIYAPFIILQAYSIIVRIAEYGVTPSRYSGIILIVLEILYTIFYAFFRKHIDKLILVMMCITVIATIVPGANAIDFSRLSQKSILADYVKNGFPESESEVKKLMGAYEYIKNEYSEAYVNNLCGRKLQNQLDEVDFSHSTTELYGIRTNLHTIPTNGHDYVAEFNSVCDSFDGDVPSQNMIIKVNGESVATYDFTEEYKSVIERNIANNDSYIDEPDMVKISDDCELLIDNMTVTVDTKDDSLVELRIYGYILMDQRFVDEHNL